ncbi:MAG: NUDIX hydrolase [Phycisphaerales bacterium JB060]
MGEADTTPAPIDTRVLYEGAKFNVELLTLPGRGGNTREMAVVRHPGACAILPILHEPTERECATLVMIRNQRPAVGDTLWEIPAGTIDPGEEPLTCAGRELIEETGYEAATLEPSGRFYTTPGMTDEVMHLFVARGLTHVGQDLDEGEHIEVHEVKADEALAMIEDGRLRDAKSVIPIVRAHAAGLLGVRV